MLRATAALTSDDEVPSEEGYPALTGGVSRTYGFFTNVAV